MWLRFHSSAAQYSPMCSILVFCLALMRSCAAGYLLRTRVSLLCRHCLAKELPALALWCAIFSGFAGAGVTRVELIGKTDVRDGASFGKIGAYQRIVAKVHFAVDPRLAPNRIVADIDLAPKNNRGLVEFSADLYILQ